MEFNFSLKFQLAERPYASRHYAALCAWESTGVRVLADRRGRMRAEFVRRAPSARTAMRRAMGEAVCLFPSAQVVEAAPDYVTLSQVARIFRMSRQAMRKRMLAFDCRFPAPVHEANGAIWHLAEILEWMDRASGAFYARSVLEGARAAAGVNLAVETRRMRAVRSGTWDLIDLPRQVERNQRTRACTVAGLALGLPHSTR